MRKGGSEGSRWRGILLTALAFLAMILVLVFGLQEVGDRNGDEQTRILESAVRRATLTCYAVEGRYPPGVEYLKSHYGIMYDDDKYIVTLSSFASNVMPDIFVLTQGGVEDEW